jgi:hypothetical protein
LRAVRDAELDVPGEDGSYGLSIVEVDALMLLGLEQELVRARREVPKVLRKALLNAYEIMLAGAKKPVVEPAMH